MSTEQYVKMEIEEVIKKIRDIADMDCTCSYEQQAGIVCGVCVSCDAGQALNTISEIAMSEYRLLMRCCKKVVNNEPN